jgi:hypothetical protein
MRSLLRNVGLAAMAFVMAPTACALAQEVAPTGEYKEGMVVGGWTLFPKIFVGATFDDNTHQSATGDTEGFSARVVPHLVGIYQNGMHRTTLYGVADARFFNSSTVTATAGFVHYYEAARDLLFTFQGNYTRQTDLFTSALNFNNGALGPSVSAESNLPVIINPFGTTPSADAVAYNQFTGAASVRKEFGQAFATLSTSVFNIVYDRTPSSVVDDAFRTSANGTSVYTTARVGYNVMPTVFVFAEGTGIFQRFDNSLFNTNGYRVVGGVGSNNPEGFFRGEVFGGYQAQIQDAQNVTASAIPTNTDSPIFGGRVYYFPTRYWTFMAQVDQTLGISTILSPTIPQGTPSKVTNAILQTTYGLSRVWSVGARVGYTRGEFTGIDRLDTGWMAGGSFNYEVWRNLLLTLDYQYTILHSNIETAEFTRNVYTAGLTYKY